MTVKFASEIAAAPYNGDEWAWIKGRIQAANWEGIWVGDYIPFTADGYNFKAEIAGIDTYYRYGDVMVPHHIDFVCRELWPEKHIFNTANSNNGTTINSSPWLTSDLYQWLNNTVKSQLPAKLTNVIIEKRALMVARFTQGEQLNNDIGWTWGNAGKLWILSEIEVCNHIVWGTVTAPTQGFTTGSFQQYPLFAQNMKRVKQPANTNELNDNRANWWLLDARGGDNYSIACINARGEMAAVRSSDNLYTPICFRVA